MSQQRVSQQQANQQLWTPQRLPGENVIIYDPVHRRALARGHNIITDVGRQQLMLFLKGSSPIPPGYIGLSAGVLASKDHLALQTNLTSEYYRAQIAASGKVLDALDVARLTLAIGQGLGVGTIKQVGLFDDVTKSTILNNCESATGWSDPNGPGSLDIDSVDYQEGAASMKDVGSASLDAILQHSTLSITLTNYLVSTTRLQFWAKLSNWLASIGQDVRVGNDASNYWQFTNPFVDHNNWQYLDLALSSAAVVGSPSLSSAINYFRTRVGIYVPAGRVTLRLDAIRMFSSQGNLWAIFQLDTPIEKTQQDQIVVSWYLTAAEGDTDVADKVSFAREQLTVTNGSIKLLTSGTYAPSGGSPAQRATIRIVSGDPVVIDPLGSPNNAGTVGTIWYPGEEYEVQSQEDIATIGLIGYVPSGMSRTTSTIIEASYKR